MATYAIGDVHGEAAALRELLEQVEPLLEPEDTLVFLGDLIDRGPDSRGCLDLLCDLYQRAPCRVEALLGNHEEWLLQTWRDPRRYSWLVGMEGLSTVRSYSPEAALALEAELRAKGDALLRGATLDYGAFFAAVPGRHWRLLEALPASLETPDVLCAHGGAEPGVPWDEQPRRSLVWGGSGFPDSWTGPRPLVYGHRGDALVDASGRAAPRINASGCAFGVDAVARGALLCLRFPDLACFQARSCGR